MPTPMGDFLCLLLRLDVQKKNLPSIGGKAVEAEHWFLVSILDLKATLSIKAILKASCVPT